MPPAAIAHCRYSWTFCLLLTLLLPGCAGVKTSTTRPAPPLPPLTQLPTTAGANNPYLRIETGMHTAAIIRIAVDAQERYLVTASLDKTSRVWDLRDGHLLQILRPPIGEGDEGKIDAVAISPDGTTVSVGGFTGPQGKSKNIYIFDRENGRLTRTIGGLPSCIDHLAYSLDGRYLAAALGEQDGIRIFHASSGREVGRDTNYGDDSYWVEFDRRGRLLSSSVDGNLRLYGPGFRRLAKQFAPGGMRPFAARFSPGGDKIAVGFHDSTAVDILDGTTLSPISSLDTHGINNGDLGRTAWSLDGQWQYAGGSYDDADGNNLIVRWPRFGNSLRSVRPATTNTLSDLRALSHNRLAFGAYDPAWGVLDASGHKVLEQKAAILDYRSLRLRLAEDGSAVGFLVRRDNAIGQTQFDLRQRTWLTDAQNTEALGLPRIVAPSLEIAGWEDTTAPMLNGQPLHLQPYERSRSLAIAPNGQSFLLGTEWSLRLFDRQGLQAWPTRVAVPSVAWAVNISGDGRWAVAAFGDGTIRWYGMEDGRERLALFPHADGQRWVLWTPEGFFDASPGAEELIGYHLNQGPDREGQFVEAKQLASLFYRPDLVAKRFEGDERPIREALAQIGDVRQVLAAGLPPRVELLSQAEVRQTEADYTLRFQVHDQGGGIGRLIFRVNGQTLEGRPVGVGIPGRDPLERHFALAPGDNRVEVLAANPKGVESRAVAATVHVDRPRQAADLYVLAVGISQYRDHAMQLKYADRDAEAMARELERRGQGLFRAVHVTPPLLNQAATLANVKKAFADLAGRVQPQDVFVLYLAGHGKALDGAYHFVPWEMVYENEQALRTGSLDQDSLRDLLASIPAQKSVVLLDTCEAGAFNLASRGLEQKTAIDRLMRATGRAVLAATSDTQMALEGFQDHGVFTAALLEGLANTHDPNANGQIEIDELAGYVMDRVPKITQEKWHYEQYPMRDLHGMVFPIGLR